MGFQSLHDVLVEVTFISSKMRPCRHGDIRTSENAGFHCTDSHTVCTSIPRWNLWFELKEHQIAP